VRRALPALVCAAFLAGAPLHAQERLPGQDARDSSDALDPAELDALQRRCPPALQRSAAPQPPAAQPARAVDLEAAHQRALAMYAEGVLFHAPLPAPGSPPAPKPIFEPAPRSARPGATPWALIAGLASSALLIAWFLLRVRPALMAPPAEAVPEPQAFSWKPARRSRPMKPIWPAEPAGPLPQHPAVDADCERPPRDPRRR
jgi:hypothetical protein